MMLVQLITETLKHIMKPSAGRILRALSPSIAVVVSLDTA